MSPKISAAERAKRDETLRQVRHSSEMEGGRSSDAARAEQDAYARGELTSDELVSAAQQRARTAGAAAVHG